MSTQICPNCQEDSFTWSVDDEISELTIWGCHQCNYQAFENELEEWKCMKCGKNTVSKLKDKGKEYWWCSTCNMTELIKNYT